MHMCTGAETVFVDEDICCCTGAEGPAPFGAEGEKAWLATAWRREAASAGFGDALTAACAAAGVGCKVAGVGAVPGAGRRNMLSMVGRKAAPKGVERKSEGRSMHTISFHLGW